jgi:rRNA maturation endonuclease Nob1
MTEEITNISWHNRCEACVVSAKDSVRLAGEDRCGRCGTYGRVFLEQVVE